MRLAGIRRAGVGDAAAIAAIDVEAWQATYPGMLPDGALIRMSPLRKARQWACELRNGADGVWVWEDEWAGVLGFGHCGRQRMPSLPYEGEITMLYVLPDAQGQGIGRGLLTGMLADLRSQGMRSALVWVLAANPSRFFYARMDAKLVLRRTIEVDGTPVEAVGYGWTDLVGLPKA